MRAWSLSDCFDWVFDIARLLHLFVLLEKGEEFCLVACHGSLFPLEGVVFVFFFFLFFLDWS